MIKNSFRKLFTICFVLVVCLSTIFAPTSAATKKKIKKGTTRNVTVMEEGYVTVTKPFTTIASVGDRSNGRTIVLSHTVSGDSDFKHSGKCQCLYKLQCNMKFSVIKKYKTKFKAVYKETYNGKKWKRGKRLSRKEVVSARKSTSYRMRLLSVTSPRIYFIKDLTKENAADKKKSIETTSVKMGADNTIWIRYSANNKIGCDKNVQCCVRIDPTNKNWRVASIQEDLANAEKNAKVYFKLPKWIMDS